ncbi:MAG: efflux RND transporter periplasmic adaptor subunit [Maricaulaceae bacterium]|nr:efflux RND transporter periplasmic adaptor subunit [Maricaulaceae bacterium]
MRIQPSYVAAAVIFAAFVTWFTIGTLTNSNGNGNGANDGETPARSPRVVAQTLHASEYPAYLVLRGRTEAVREVTVRAETSARVVETPAADGAYVTEGDILCRLDVSARQAALDQARAELTAREQEHQAGLRLQERGFRSANAVAALQATRDAARAQVEAARQELARTVIRAPFEGWFDRRQAEVGDFLTPGQPCGVMVELDPILVAAQVSEQDVAALAAGMPGTARLVTGEVIQGEIRRVERRADPATRTFRMELTAPNPDGALRAGVTAELRIPLAPRMAHRAPTTVLTLDAGGRLGVRWVDEQNRVRFSPVDLLADDGDGVWLSGLPETVRVIVIGQDFVEDGAAVEAVERP